MPLAVLVLFQCCPGGSGVKNSPANAGVAGSIPGSGRSPGGGHGNPLEHSRLGNPMDRGAWRAAVYGVAKSQTRLITHARSISTTGVIQRKPRNAILAALGPMQKQRLANVRISGRPSQYFSQT